MRLQITASNIHSSYELMRPIEQETGQQSILNEVYLHYATSTHTISADGHSTACVDSRLRVRGVDGPRVLDWSGFP